MFLPVALPCHCSLTASHGAETPRLFLAEGKVRKLGRAAGPVAGAGGGETGTRGPPRGRSPVSSRRNKHIMIDLGTGNNNKINWAMEDKQEMIDIIETVYRGARKGRGLVVSPKDYSTKYRY